MSALGSPLVPLGYLARVRPSGVDKKTDADEISVRLCNYTDVYYHAEIANDLPFMEATATQDELSRFSLRSGDVVITKDSETPDDIAVPALVVEDLDRVVLGYHNALLRPDPSKVLPRFLYWALRSRATAAYFETKARGVTRFGLRTDDIAAVPIPAPPIETQRAVVERLDAETRAIDTLIQHNAEAVRLLRSRLDEVIATRVTTGFGEAAVDSPLGWARRLNPEWDLIPFQFLARTGSGHTPSRSEPAYWVDCHIPWVTTSDLALLREGRVEVLDETRYRISELGIANSSARVHPASTVFLSRTASVGFSAVMGTDMATSQDFFTWTCGPRLDPYFLLYVLRAMRTRGLFDRMMFGSTHKTIYVPALMELAGPVPSRSEQSRIVEDIRQQTDFTFSAIDTITKQVRLLHERRQALVTATVAGALAS